MNFQQILVSLFVVLACNFVTVWTQSAKSSSENAEHAGQPYSITFIPAIHSGDCRAGEVWYPRDTQCAMCRCIINRFSRCIPRPGCVVTVTTTTPSATAASTPTMTPQAEVEGPGSNGSNNTNFIYFVPAIHSGSCTPGTVWYPEDTQCARCRCIFNTFSRCIPTPGCQPTLSPTVPTTTTEMTGMEAESSPTVDMGMDTSGSGNSTQMVDMSPSPVTENSDSGASANSTSVQTTMAGNTTLFPRRPNRVV